MRYNYECALCSIEKDVIKSHKLIDREEQCPKCSQSMVRKFKPGKLFLYGFKNNEHFNRGLNCWVNDTKHAERIAKSRNLIPVGDDNQKCLQAGSGRIPYEV